MVFGLLLVKNKVSKSCWIIMGSSWTLLIKKPYRISHTIPKWLIFWKAMWFSNEELLSSIKCRTWTTWTSSCHLTHICCLPAFTDENCGETSWQEQTVASVNQTHLAWCRVFECKSGCEHRDNPIWIHDSSNIIIEKVGKNKLTWDCFSWHVRLQLLCS